MNSTTTPSGYWGGYFLKELTMDPLGMGWANCFRTHNELTMDPLGILVFAPSGYERGSEGVSAGSGESKCVGGEKRAKGLEVAGPRD